MGTAYVRPRARDIVHASRFRAGHQVWSKLNGVNDTPATLEPVTVGRLDTEAAVRDGYPSPSCIMTHAAEKFSFSA
jgi:hypothetical protein